MNMRSAMLLLACALCAAEVATPPKIDEGSQPADILAMAERATAQAFMATPSHWTVSVNGKFRTRAFLQVWTCSARDWRLIRSMIGTEAGDSEARFLGEMTYFRVGGKAVEVVGMPIRRQIPALEGSDLLRAKSDDPPAAKSELGSWRGQPAYIISASSDTVPLAQTIPTAVRWIATRADLVIRQVERYDGDSEVISSATLESLEILPKADPAMFTPWSDVKIVPGQSPEDLTGEFRWFRDAR